MSTSVALLHAMLVSAMIASFVGCAAQPEAQDETGAAPAAAADPVQTPPAITTATDTGPWWRDPLFTQLATALDDEWAIDNQTQLLRPASFRADAAYVGPLGRRPTNPSIEWALRARYGIVLDRGLAPAHDRARVAREQAMARLGPLEFWTQHLALARTEIALVTQSTPDGTDGDRLRWVPVVTTLLFPLPGSGFVRTPGGEANLDRIQGELKRAIGDTGLTEVPSDLESYLAFVDETLELWKAQGAVAIKFVDAYVRTLRFDAVDAERAAALYASGIARPLARDEYIEVQNHIARHIFTSAAQQGLVVHLHSSSGTPPFLRLGDADVRNLEVVLTDAAFFGTQFVLIHGGYPLTREAAYLAMKPNVWLDISGMGWLPAPDLAEILRHFLLTASERVLFSTNATNLPGVPGGPEIHHLARSRTTRDALTLALAGLVRDGVIDVDAATELGRGVPPRERGTALRLGPPAAAQPACPLTAIRGRLDTWRSFDKSKRMRRPV